MAICLQMYWHTLCDCKTLAISETNRFFFHVCAFPTGLLKQWTQMHKHVFS